MLRCHQLLRRAWQQDFKPVLVCGWEVLIQLQHQKTNSLPISRSTIGSKEDSGLLLYAVTPTQLHPHADTLGVVLSILCAMLQQQ